MMRLPSVLINVLWLSCLAATAMNAGAAEATAESAPVRIDLREDVGGRLAHGAQWMSPLAKVEAGFLCLFIDRHRVSDWSGDSPYWNTESYDDGRYEAMLREDTKRSTVTMVVLNSEDVAIHGGVLTGNETWSAEKIHLVQDWVRIPENVTLSLQPGAIVKFCQDTGFIVDGAVDAREAVFTYATDSRVGGDTGFLDEPEFVYDGYVFEGDGDIRFEDCDFRQLHRLPCDTVWRADSVHTVHGRVTVPAGTTLEIAAGAIVKFADGGELYCEDGGAVLCENAIFTHIADDTAGGDTNGDGEDSQPVYNAYTLTGFTPAESCELRYYYRKFADLSVNAGETVTLPEGSLYQMDGDVTVAAGGELRVMAGAVVKMAEGRAITVQAGGRLTVAGTLEKPAVITSLHDSSAGGKSDGSAGREASAGDWAGIVSHGTIQLEYAHVSYAGSEGGALTVMDGQCIISRSAIDHSAQACVLVKSGAFTGTNSLLLSSKTGCALEAPGTGWLVNCVVYDMDTALTGTGLSAVNTVFDRIGAFGLAGTEDTIRYCLFHNPAQQGESSCPLVGNNGNIWGDPLFLDADGGNFKLGDASPCIDAGDGTACAESDYWGTGRTDALAIKNTGVECSNGGWPEIGIHEFPGSLPVVRSFDMAAGWNFLSLPSALTDSVDNEKIWNALNCQTVNDAGTGYCTAAYPGTPGKPLWGYSASARTVTMKMWSAAEATSVWTSSLENGWRLAGVVGEGEVLYGEDDAESVWSWQNGRWCIVEREEDGYRLKPFMAYFIRIK